MGGTEPDRGPSTLEVRHRRVLAGVLLTLSAALLGLAPPAAQGPAVEPALLVDPNTAPVGVLLALPRIGPTLAGRIVAARGRGRYERLDDLDARVRGVGPVTAAALRPFLRFGPGDAGATARP